MELYDKHFWCMEVNPGEVIKFDEKFLFDRLNQILIVNLMWLFVKQILGEKQKKKLSMLSLVNI